MAIIFIAIGLLFTGVDFLIAPGIAYPTYVAPKGPIGGFTIHDKIQEYVTQNILGGQLQVDILPDVLGCVFIIIGTLLLLKHNKNYIVCVFLAIIRGGVSVALRVMPFFVNSAALIIWTLVLYFFSIVFEIWLEYKVIYMTVAVSDDMANVSTNRRMQFCWWVSVFARMFIFLLTFVGISSVR